MKMLMVFSGLLLCAFLLLKNTFFKSGQIYEVTDVGRFWQACDSLKNAGTTADSIRLLQTLYISKMSKLGRLFLEVRGYTAAEYVRTLRKHPGYFKMLRIKTNRLTAYRTELDSAFKKLKAILPGYQVPDVCFAIGCFRGGGTTRKGVVLLGAEIALADSTMNFSEFKGNLHDILARGINLPELVAHESIHIQQHNAKNRTLLSIALQEGTADFLPSLAFAKNMGNNAGDYERLHECELWQEFKPDINGTDLSKWLFNAGTIKNRPPDLGYFIGRRICEAYYLKQPDKKEAIKNLLDRSKYLEVLAESGYDGNCVK